MKRFIVMLAAGGAAAGLALTASATSLVRMDLADMVDRSAAVVVGEVTGQHATETAYGLYTMTTFSVSDEVVGDAGTTVTVATPGGVRVSGKFKLAETWPGAPVFAQGQEVLMFITPDDGAVGAQIVGFSQGAAAVLDTPRGKAVRMPDGSGEVVSLETAKERIRQARDANVKTRMGRDVADQ